ncbi:MAG: WYL domain-containing protein, partial [Acidimicrobiia bacterium]|nr:WYL domain-containing protein [Acidimicrobiia bacterium]
VRRMTEKTGRRGADEKLQRLLALVPWVAARDGPTLAEVCERFGCTEEELVSDLDQLFMCGLYPYTPDVLIEVDVADARVWIRYADYFSRPLRLTPAEGLALLAAGKAVQSFPGADQTGPLARGLAKLAKTLGIGSDDALDVALASVPEDVMATLRSGVDQQRQVELDYYSFGRDEVTSRVVDPYAVFSAGGQWYLSAYCHGVDDDRLFRVDRVRGATLLDTPVEHTEGSVAAAVYTARDDDPRVTIELKPSGRWVTEQYPVEASRELKDGRRRVTMAISERAWLERLLLRLGGDGRVTKATDPALTDAGRDAACRILRRYRPTAR